MIIKTQLIPRSTESARMNNTDISMNIETDKLLHLLAGCTIAGAVHPFGILAAVIALFIVGIGKEVYDHFEGGTVDVYDAAATVWGGAVMLGWLEIAQAFA
jgi:hypothetical protein